MENSSRIYAQDPNITMAKPSQRFKSLKNADVGISIESVCIATVEFHRELTNSD